MTRTGNLQVDREGTPRDSPVKGEACMRACELHKHTRMHSKAAAGAPPGPTPLRAEVAGGAAGQEAEGTSRPSCLHEQLQFNSQHRSVTLYKVYGAFTPWPPGRALLGLSKTSRSVRRLREAPVMGS